MAKAERLRQLEAPDMGGPEQFRPPSIAVGGLQALLATVAVLVSQLVMILHTHVSGSSDT
jgi:hypothetical protein